MKQDLTIGVMYPSAFLKCEDLRGAQCTVTITEVVMTDVPMAGGKSERCVVASMKGTKKQWIVGKTNGYALAVLLGPDGHVWVGRRVTLCPDTDRLGGTRVPCVRVAGSPDASEPRSAAYAEA